METPVHLLGGLLLEVAEVVVEVAVIAVLTGCVKVIAILIVEEIEN